MSVPVVKPAVPMVPQTSLEHLKGKATDTSIERRERLRRAAQEFESLFYYQILKTMRKTVPESPFSEGGPVSGSAGKDIFMDMFDQELSKNVNAGGTGSLAAMLFEQLEKTLEGDEVQASDGTTEMIPLDSESAAPVNLDGREIPLESEEGPIPLGSDRPDFRSVGPPQMTAPADSIMRRYGRWIDEAAKENKIDSTLIWAVIKAESGGDPKAESLAGAKGLMQLVDSTAEEMGVREVFDARENIVGGSKYLRKMLDRFGDVKLALAAYNAGPSAVDRHHGIPPYAETRAYVERVTGYLSESGSRITNANTKGR